MQCMGCLTKSSDNMAFDGFWLIVSANLQFPLSIRWNRRRLEHSNVITNSGNTLMALFQF